MKTINAYTVKRQDFSRVTVRFETSAGTLSQDVTGMVFDLRTQEGPRNAAYEAIDLLNAKGYNLDYCLP